MKKEVKKQIKIILILTASSFILGRNSVSKKVEIRYKEKIVKVTDLKEKNQENEKKNVEVITKIIYKTDGTKIKEIREIDKTEIERKNLIYQKEKISKKSQLDKKVTYNQKKVTISAFTSFSPLNPALQMLPEFGLLTQFPIFSSINAGIGLSNQERVYLSIGISF